MTDHAHRKQALENIRRNIVRSGQHIYVVSGGATPRFAYTVGLSESVKKELIFAGGIFYMADDVIQVINDVASQLRVDPERRVFAIEPHGTFTLREAHPSWTKALLLGALDYYKIPNITALQIVPDRHHQTIDVPDLTAPWDANLEPVWRWLNEKWTYPVPEHSKATTNLAALRGERITEVARWEADEWDIFAGAGPDVPEAELRVAPLGTLIATDGSLAPAFGLPIGDGLWREANQTSEWHAWKKK